MSLQSWLARVIAGAGTTFVLRIFGSTRQVTFASSAGVAASRLGALGSSMVAAARLVALAFSTLRCHYLGCDRCHYLGRCYAECVPLRAELKAHGPTLIDGLYRRVSSPGRTGL